MNKTSKVTRTLRGEVVSTKMDKTIVVLVVRKVKHPIYGKYIQRTSKIHAHDPNNICKNGDTVIVVETKPISLSKSWVLLKVVEEFKK